MGAIADAVVAFAQPLIDATDGSREQISKALALSQACWNLALLPEEEREPLMDDMKKDMHMNDDEFNDLRQQVLIPMIRRHVAMFPGLRSSKPIEPPHRQAEPPHLLAEPPRRPKLLSAKTQPLEPGRYDPCPCGSGKKYKFCCGQKRA